MRQSACITEQVLAFSSNGRCERENTMQHVHLSIAAKHVKSRRMVMHVDVSQSRVVRQKSGVVFGFPHPAFHKEYEYDMQGRAPSTLCPWKMCTRQVCSHIHKQRSQSGA
eukprot:scaffold184295_cov22-Tisochrysis_lutea.AAC.2